MNIACLSSPLNISADLTCPTLSFDEDNHSGTNRERLQYVGRKQCQQGRGEGRGETGQTNRSKPTADAMMEVKQCNKNGQVERQRRYARGKTENAKMEIEKWTRNYLV